MPEVAPEYIAARRVLLDALTALEDHLDNLILVGAQAVYHHTKPEQPGPPLAPRGLRLTTSRPLASPAGWSLRWSTTNPSPSLPSKSTTRAASSCASPAQPRC